MKAKTRYAKKIEDIFRAKKEFRKERAKLPFEEKINIVVRLQQIASEAAAFTRKGKSRKPWKIDID
jgi:hypothetical protein